LNANRSPDRSNLRTSEGRERRLLLDQAVNYRRKFNRENQELTARLGLSYERRDEAGDLLTRAIPGVTGKTPPDLPGLERRRDGQRRLLGVFQVDYEHPLGGKAKVEAGLKSTFRRLDSDFRFEHYVYALADYRSDPRVSNHFRYHEGVHAAYAQYRQQLDRFAFSLGGRAELSNIRTELLTTGEANGNRYLNFFPSAKARYQFSADRHLRFVYTRRIDRPGSGSLNPFPDLTDSLNIERGNPSLRPEFIGSYELGYAQQRNRTMLAANLFYRNRRGIIEDITRLRPDGVSVEQPDNLGNGRVYGLELAGTAPLTDWWEMNASTTLFRNRLEGFGRDGPRVRAGTSWSAKVNADLKLPFRTRLQATAHYTAPVAEAQGTEGGQFYADLGLRKRWLKQKSTLGVNVRDVFNTLRRRDTTYSPDFFQRRTTYVFQRIIQFSFAYRF
jgi:outer membrane receptor protein involved in Fe transport